MLAPDSFGPRGRSTVCGIAGVVTPDMRVADIAGALDYLKTRSDVRKNHVGLMGQSHGGSTTIKSLQRVTTSRDAVCAVAWPTIPGARPSAIEMSACPC